MKKLVTLSLALLLSLATAERELETKAPAGRKRVSQPLDSYPEDVQIDFSSSLKCGACIRGDYIFCINGKEGDADLATKQ